MKVFNGIIIAAIIVLIFVIVRHFYPQDVDEQLRIYRGVGVYNDANEQPIAAGVISNSIIPSLQFGTYFDGVEQKSCELCPNVTICPHCPNFAATSEILKMATRESFGNHKDSCKFNEDGEVYTNDVVADFERANVLISEQNQQFVEDQKTAESAVYRGANYLTMGPTRVADFFPNGAIEASARCIYTQKRRNLHSETEMNRILYGEILGLDYLAPAIINEPTDIAIKGDPYYRVMPNNYEYKYE